MKQLLLFAAVLISLSVFAQHPTDKGWRSVGGTGRLHLDFDWDDGIDNSLSLTPEFYWFVANSFGVGTDIGASVFSHKRESDTLTARSISMNAWVAPGVHFYFRDPEKAWRPYVFLNAGYRFSGSHVSLSGPIISHAANTHWHSLIGYTGAGLGWFFSDHAAFDIRMRVLDVDVYEGFQDNIESDWNYSPSFSIGIQAFFD